MVILVIANNTSSDSTIFVLKEVASALTSRREGIAPSWCFREDFSILLDAGTAGVLPFDALEILDLCNGMIEILEGFTLIR